ncbi:glycoside hydrolase family 18 protein [Elizabethkingia argenteiflava]|uniref:glycosyl hydrolase family 18 protein n=1 Tax=Elizabethkingia argenteiflava TaxID=2681556 RepID=UPI001FCE59E2|nr:glycosyl hydrolase family 18 protein [Elizabethkingia argenteiflava]
MKNLSYHLTIWRYVLIWLTVPFLCISCYQNNDEIHENTTLHSKEVGKSLPKNMKDSGILLFSITEVGNTNPLNNLNFTLKNSGKPLVDMVVLFSANINYDEKNDKVYVHNNQSVQHLLTNRQKYLQPLKNKGIKVILSILGNWDRSGIANLSTERAQQFAQELKNTCETYDLDGVFFRR